MTKRPLDIHASESEPDAKVARGEETVLPLLPEIWHEHLVPRLRIVDVLRGLRAVCRAFYHDYGRLQAPSWLATWPPPPGDSCHVAPEKLLVPFDVQDDLRAQLVRSLLTMNACHGMTWWTESCLVPARASCGCDGDFNVFTGWEQGHPGFGVPSLVYHLAAFFGEPATSLWVKGEQMGILLAMTPRTTDTTDYRQTDTWFVCRLDGFLPGLKGLLMLWNSWAYYIPPGSLSTWMLIPARKEDTPVLQT